MPFNKFHNEPSCLMNRIDAAMLQAQTKTESVCADITSSAISKTVYMNESAWKVKEVDLNFSAATARSFNISKVVGANIVGNKNNKFWFYVTGYGTRICTITPNYYSDSTFATAVKAAIESAFSDSALTFTVTYSSKKMRITNGGSVAVKFIFDAVDMPHRYSTAAANMGFTQNTSSAAVTINADVATDIGTTYHIIAESSNTALNYVFNEPIEMDSDSSLQVTTGTAAIIVSLRISYGA